MEEPNEEWEIQEYAISESNFRGKVSWILSKGLGFGKKVLISGILISSAPLVVPPLLIVSAIGVAVSVPSGVLLASYACAEKLMSKLLPRPEPILLEYGLVKDGEQDIILDEGDDEWLGENIDMRREEEEEKEDIKAGVETRVELLEKENNEIEEWKAKEEVEDHVEEDVKMNSQEKIEGFDEKKNDKTGGKASGDCGGEVVKMNERGEIGDNVDDNESLDKESNEKEARKVLEGDGYGQEGIKRNAQEEEMGDVDVIVEKNGYEEDVGEYLDMEEETPLEQTDGVQIEGDGEVHGVVLGLIESDEQNGEATIEVTSVVMEKNGGRASVNGIEEEEIEKETRGLLETIGDEGKDVSTAEKETQGGEENGEQRVITSGLEDIEIPVEAKIVDSDVGLVKNVERNIKEEPKQGQEIQDRKYIEDVNDEPRDIKAINKENGNISENKTIDHDFVAEKPIGEMSNSATVHNIVVEKQTPVLNSFSTLQGEKAEDNIANVDPKIKEKEIVALSNADAREVGAKIEFDDKNIDSGQNPYAVYTTPHDVVEHPVSRRTDETKDAGVSSGKEVSTPLKEVLYNEEKIWEQIDAIRSIVGYKVAPQKTCIEELKALYIFTGVQPPASFKHPSDLTEVNDKLHFLMSIIGLK
ncbi:hypothetical protein FNV43_RR02867 [Rhamnella rubrinervis]|uniref:Uncharacterized protein n=1 Tax=Rhamnella rubrinervis TaxID=2594499 RepID=A0A8K0MNH6_9ROSA|nr:hypothetical protein FNV43_RR02867 [Rhamnella rubrinervis]